MLILAGAYTFLNMQENSSLRRDVQGLTLTNARQYSIIRYTEAHYKAVWAVSIERTAEKTDKEILDTYNKELFDNK
ncbi:hypothetical protein ACI1UM_10625 [Lactococcus petauri]|uniref:hypothetical protein n=1 Tax=Lactococcus petauri TaxID=1940789 RepID=UPI003854703C